MKHCYVTGANGFLGSSIVRELLRKGYEVTALVGADIGRENIEGLPIKVRSLDVLDRAGVYRALCGGMQLIHTAANYSFWLPDPRLAYRVNAEGTRNVLVAARDLGYEKVVYTSSVATLSPGFGDGEDDEDNIIDLRRFRGHYKTSKVMAELVATRLAAEGFPVVITYPTSILGPGDRRPTPTGSMIVHFVNGRMKVFVELPQNLVDVEDVASGHVLALEKGSAGQRYVLGGDNLTMREVVKLLAQLTGIPAPKVALSHNLLFILGKIDEFLSDHVTRREPLFPLEAALHARDSRYFGSTRAIQELGYAPRPARSVLARAVAWFVTEGFASDKYVRVIERHGVLAEVLAEQGGVGSASLTRTSANVH